MTLEANEQPDLHIAKHRGYSPEKLYDSLHLEITVSMVALDHVCNPLAALHPGLNKLGKHLQNSLTRARALLLENGWGDAAELESKVILLPVPPPLLKIHDFHFRTKWFGFDGRIVRVIREAGGR